MSQSDPALELLLGKVRAFFASYVVVPSAAFLDVITLWIAHSHAIAAAETTPRLLFKSPEKESGKTRALEVLELLTPNPLGIINTTIAAVFRLLDQEQATILYDEVDAVFGAKPAPGSEDLRALLNGGYRRGATVARVVGDGKKMRVQRFPVFAATALAAIGDLPDTIESRSIIIPMRRRAPDEQVIAFRRRKAQPEGEVLRDFLKEWAEHYVEQLANADPAMPAGVDDRAADCWEPLLAIAELAGSDWTTRAHAAAMVIVSGRVAEDLSIGVRLLADTRAAIGPSDRMSSACLVAGLNTMDDAGWGGWHDGKGLTARDLARRLKPYGIRPRTIRLDDNSTPKGYLRDDFVDSWARYLRTTDTPSVGSATSATSATPIRIDVADVADVALVGEGEMDDGGYGNGHSRRVAVVMQGADSQLVDEAGESLHVGLFANPRLAAQYALQQGWMVIDDSQEAHE